MIKNPAYKGIWEAPDIDNPEYKHDDKLYQFKDSKFVGFELWQVRGAPLATGRFDYSLSVAVKCHGQMWHKAA